MPTGGSDAQLVAVGLVAHQMQAELCRKAGELVIDYPELAKRMAAIGFLLGDLLEYLRTLGGEGEPPRS